VVPELGLFTELLEPGAKSGGGPDAERVSGAASGAVAGVGGAIELSLGPGELSAGELGRLPGVYWHLHIDESPILANLCCKPASVNER
jgi:hypothetical protein